jgi:REP element-mobilizing transposase RayT
MTKFDPQKRHRRSIRLKEYDYSQPGAYFVTLVAFRREAILGEIIDGEVKLNATGNVVRSVWEDLPGHYPGLELDKMIVMPISRRTRPR